MAESVAGMLPNVAPDGPLGTEKKGLVSPIGDPAGQVLDKGLKPTLGRITGAIGIPTGEAMMSMINYVKEGMGYPTTEEREKGEKEVGKEGKADKELPGGERFGGNVQTGQNPLGL